MLVIKENNSATVLCTVLSKTGALQDITGWSFEFLAISGSTVLVDKTSADSSEIFITNAAGGKVSVFFVPSDTAGKPGSYQFEFKGTDVSGNEYTLIGPATLQVTPTII